MFYVSGLVFLDSTENPDLCIYCDTAWPHICLPCLRSSGMHDTFISCGIISEYLNKVEKPSNEESFKFKWNTGSHPFNWFIPEI